jgi:nitrogen-specific signal transduction histidine kinase
MAKSNVRTRSKNDGEPRTDRFRRAPAVLRLLEAERSEEIFPILLEEIVELGFARAFVLAVDYETGEITPVASLHCGRSYVERFRTSLYATDVPWVGLLTSQQPAVLENPASGVKKLYCQPAVFRSANTCWEADRDHRADCLAYANQFKQRELRLDDQVCRACVMRGYAALVCVELKRESAKELDQLRELIEISNRHMTRLFKVEHYYNRMTDMELTISQMETMLQSMTDPVILTDTHYRVVLQNKEAELYFKLPEEHSEKPISEGLVRAIELNNLLYTAALSSMALSGSNAHRDLTLVDVTEGEERLFEAVCTPTYARDGMLIGIVTVMRDVTDLRRADQELRHNYDLLRQAEDLVRQDRDRLNVIIENVGDPIVVCDSNAKIVLLDPLAEQLFGVGSSQDSRNAAVVKNQAQLDAYIYSFTYSFAAKETGTLRLYNTTTKSEIEYDARSGKIYDDRGQVAYTVTVFRDFTALRKMEQLRLERRMLEVEKFAAAGRLAATIAHEVNNPMEAIKNAIWLLQDSVKAEAEPVYEILKAETERVSRIVRQMLGLYRNNEQVKPVNINTIVEDTMVLLNRQLQRANITIEQDFGEIPEAIVAADQLRQVLSNLVINAKDAMPEGGKLWVRTRHLSNSSFGRDAVRILIADTGMGIPRELQQTVFDPFVTTKGEKGTGLGLWIVRGIIHNHGGKISVRSLSGRGTVFKIDLPVVPLVA